jgi:hypothetical protein
MLQFRTNKLGSILKLTDLELQMPTNFVPYECQKQLVSGATSMVTLVDNDPIEVLWTAACQGACPEPDWDEKTNNTPSPKNRRKP